MLGIIAALDMQSSIFKYGQICDYDSSQTVLGQLQANI